LRNIIVAAVALVAFGVGAANAADHTMTSAELSALLKDGKTLTLGGPGMGMTGQLVINKDGSAAGQGKLDSGQTFTISGKWLIKGNQFCRTWQGGRDSGKQVCETWVMTGPTTVKSMVKGKQIGVNSWS